MTSAMRRSPHRAIRSLAMAGVGMSALMVGAGAGDKAQAATVTLGAASDTSIYNGTAGSETLSDGSGPYLWLSVTAQSLNRRALLRFDVSGIPAGSVVREVRLSLYESRSRERHTVSAHRLLGAWGEGTSNGGSAGTGAPATPGDATWLRSVYPDVAWSTPGGDFIATASASIVVDLPNEFYIWGSTAGLVADVQAWIAQPSTNHGWILIGDEQGVRNAKRFVSRQGDASVAPRLQVVYDPPGPAAEGDVPLPAWALAMLGAALGARVLGRRKLRRHAPSDARRGEPPQ